MAKRILVLSGSPQKDGNTQALVEWFAEGARSGGAPVDIVHVASLKHASIGCTSCRACQTRTAYACVIPDGVTEVLKRMAEVEVIVMATPLYFFGPSAQIKIVCDRMFSLYKWDNAAGTMTTALGGKLLVLLASAYEAVGLDDLARPFILTAEYTGMKFKSLLVPNAGVSGALKGNTAVREKTVALGADCAK